MVEFKTKIVFIARVVCKRPKRHKPDYKWCYITLPMDARPMLEGRWVRVVIEPIEEQL